MPTTKTNGVDYAIENIDGKPVLSEDWANGQNQASLRCHVKWEDWPAWRVDMFGFSQYDPGAQSGTYLHRQLPERHPHYSWMVPVSVKVQGIVGEIWESGNETYQFQPDDIVVADVTYRGARYSLREDWDIGGTEFNRYIQRQRKYGNEALPLTGIQFCYEDSPNQIIATQGTQGPTIPYPFTDLVFEWLEVPHQDYDIPRDLEERLLAYPGKVNADWFGRYAPETLLCGVPEVVEELSALGYLQFKITYHFQHRAAGWNTKFRLRNAQGNVLPGFYGVQLAGAPGVKPYRAVDFAKLFTLAP